MPFPESMRRRLGRMSWIRTPAALWSAVAVVAVFSVALLRPVWHRSLPDFAEIEDTSARKAAFFAFLEPYVQDANKTIIGYRSRLKGIRGSLPHGPLNRRDARWLRDMATGNGIDLDPGEPLDQDLVDELLLRVDIIPPSLALAQAALESGWGSSRFARKGNNLFGIWCYEPGCGIVPRHRPPSATYEVASYRSPRDSFLAYIQLLNSNPAYRNMWLLRQQARFDGSPIKGHQLASGLRLYSQERERYIQKVQGLIRANRLDALDD